MDRFNFQTADSDKGPLLLDGARDSIPRLDKNYITAAPKVLRALLEASATAEAAMIRQTIIYRSSIEAIMTQGNSQQIASAVRNWLHGSPDAFFMIQQDGDHISVSNPRGDSADLGGYKPGMYESLANKDNFPHKINHTHTDHVSELLNISPGTLVCETGAGLDIGRITKLASNAKARGGYLLCHDTPPLLAKVGRERMPEVPYIALPPFRKFLGRALEQYDGRRVMTMKNTLTSLEPEEVDELLAVMETSRIEQLVVSQSLGPNMDLFTPGGQKAIEQATQDLAFKTASERTIDQNSRNIIMVVIAERAKQFAYTALLEILFQNLTDKAARTGYYIEKKTTSTAHTDLRNEDAIMFMQTKGIDCKVSFKQGIFNEVSFTPTAILYTKSPTIPQGTLRIHSTQVHLTFSRSPNNTNAIATNGRHPHGLFIPALHTLRATVLPNLNADILKFDPHTDRDIEETATYNGLAVAFDLLGATMGTPIVKQYCGTQFERKMYESFGVSVDS